MFNMKEYCCALNPDILEGLIEVLGDAETKSMMIMREYNKDLHDFQCKTKLKYFVGNYEGSTPPEYKDVQLRQLEERILVDVKLIKSQISQQSWLSIILRNIYDSTRG